MANCGFYSTYHKLILQSFQDCVPRLVLLSCVLNAQTENAIVMSTIKEKITPVQKQHE